MAEDPQPMTLQQRIASLNAAHVGRVPGEVPLPTRVKPQLPAKRPIVKQKSFNIPSEQNTVANAPAGNLPNGPPPLPVRKAPPPLPVRKDSQVTEIEPTMPRVTATRSTSEGRIKAPAWGETELPALPQKLEKQRTNKAERPTYIRTTPSAQDVAVQIAGSVRRPSATPPPLPVRKASSDHLEVVRSIPPVISQDMLDKVKKASFNNHQAFNDNNNLTVSQPSTRPQSVRTPSPAAITRLASNFASSFASNDAQPPPVPVSSKPDLAAIQAMKPKMNGSSALIEWRCMVCRDFSAPDQHAALFPRKKVRSLAELAMQLTTPFSSLTDKARAIFTWLHLNIDYNVRDFFNNNVRGSTPESTLKTGLAVCEGYAALFTALATYAGLESIVCVGHGKGFGHVHIAPGSPLPPFEAGHAWNAVKIDNGEWKLIDSCWGAGHVQGKNMPYIRKFAPERFTQTNEEFGLTHFPNNKDHFFLPGGRRVSWEEYIQTNPDFWPYNFERPTMFDNAKNDYSIEKQTVCPPNRRISVRQPGTVQFRFGLLCPHWTLEQHTRKGPPPVFLLAIGGVDGRNKDHVPLQHVKGNTPGGGGDTWYADVPARELGAPGETLTCFAITTFGSRSDARGLSVQEFLAGKGRTGMGFVGVCAWELTA